MSSTAYRMNQLMLIITGLTELSVFDVARSNKNFRLCDSPIAIRFTEQT